MDSLRYWVTEMHVDGFRFDLAAALAREFYDVDRLSAFFDIIHQDPVLSQVKLDRRAVGRGRGRVSGGQFPACAGRNGTASTATPCATTGAATTAASATSPTGSPASSDLYEWDGRRPWASINFVTAHDGFTLARPGLVQRQAQRGERRGQPRRQPTTTAPGTAASRARPTTRRSSHCATGSSATSSPRCSSRRACPMICGGDEIGRTQRGNNNAYCQDNEIVVARLV